MTRIVLENVFFFLLPTFLYIIWIAFSENEWSGLTNVLSRAPLFRLFLAGAALMLGTLVLFSSRSHNNPQDVYVPAAVIDGKLEPGHSVREPDTTQPPTAKP